MKRSTFRRLASILVLFSILGIAASPIIFLSDFDDVQDARAYAYGHRETGLWSEQQYRAATAQADQMMQAIWLKGGLVGPYLGALFCVALQAFTGFFTRVGPGNSEADRQTQRLSR